MMCKSATPGASFRLLHNPKDYVTSKSNQKKTQLKNSMGKQESKTQFCLPKILNFGERDREGSMGSSRNSVAQEETSIMMMATESRLTEWTNEKHCLFLKSMESTFVNQLHKSIDAFGWHSHKNGSSGSKSYKHKLTSIRASLGQFKVLRDGGWFKINFRKDEPEVDQEEESKAPLANPSIQHHESSQISCPKAHIAISENQYPRCNFQLWRQDSIGSNTEVTGQNFNDEAREEEKSCKMQNMKRTRSSTDISSSNDQVVPSDNIFQVDNVAEPHVRLPPKD